MNLVVRIAVVAVLGLAFVSSACESHEFSSGTAGAAATQLGVALTPRRQVPPEVVDAAKPIGREVVCLCGDCPRRLVTDCECGWARRNQQTIQYALMDGHSPSAIVSAFVAAHGEKARPLPPDDLFGQVSWALPVVVVVFALAMLSWLGARTRRRAPVSAPSTSNPSPTRLPELDAAQRQLQDELDDLED